MKKIKLITFILLIILFFTIFFFSIFGINLSLKNINNIKKNKELKNNLITQIKINNVDTVYDKDTNTYFYSLPGEYENKNYILKLEMDIKYKYKIANQNINIIKVKYDKPIDVIVYDNKNYYKVKIQLTNLPIIKIETKNEIGTEEEETIFTYINHNIEQKKFTNNAKLKVRGATTKKLPKKSYRVNFYNKTYTKEKKISFSNFYQGDSLILDAIYREKSKIRNLLSTELWNDMSNKYNNIKIYSEFVEVFINNEYKGLYLLTEPINRTKLNLNKTTDSDTSFIVKSTQGILEVKYPNDDDYISAANDLTKNIISKYFKKGVFNDYNTIKTSFNIDNYVDMIIYNYFINNVDNGLYQNVYYYNNSLSNNIVYIQPWDMEWTFGYVPTVGETPADRFDCYIDHPNSKEINELIIKRYWDLRKNILTEEYFNNLINKYKNELTKGVSNRDSKKWNDYDINYELEYIKNWIKERIKYTDEMIKGLEDEL